MRVKIDDREFLVKIASTEQARKRGLSGIKSMPNDAGVLFIFPSEDMVVMHTKDMLFDLDIIYINNGKIVCVKRNVKPGKELLESCKVTHILEIKASDTPISTNSEFTIIGEKNDDGTITPADPLPNTGNNAVLDENGAVQMITKGNERVFSRIHTSQLMTLVKGKDNTDTHIKLGKLLVKILNKQDTQKKEYVKS